VTAGVAMTGVGVLTPLADDLAALGAALRAGRRTITPAAELPDVGEARIADFEATKYANVRGMRLYNRTTRLGICAARLALDDAGLDAAALGEGLGLVLASTYAHLDTLIEYDRGLATVGIQQTNPALMPLAIPSAPGATIALAFGAKAFSITLANDGASGLDALGLGARLVGSGRAAACLVVGAFSPCAELTLSLARAGQLAPADAFRVFDARHRGTALGEAGAAVILERSDHAAARGAVPKGFVRGHASTFAADPGHAERALHRAATTALAAAGVDRDGVALVSAGAGGVPERDRIEARALAALFKETAPVPVAAIKASLGDSVDGAGLLQALVALEALRAGTAPPIAGLEQPAVSGPAYLTTPTPLTGDVALVTATSPLGACAAAVVSLTEAPNR
jgi:3-oxoacyl-[acyl-carrier-protein] synthase II